MQRPRPTPDLRYVLRPENDAAYQHFEDHQTVPFDAAAPKATRGNAWWLADAALLAYWDGTEAIRRFAAAGLSAECIADGDTQLYVACSGDAVLVAFRGTESDRFADLFDNAQFHRDPWPHGEGSVHRGFAHALDRVWTPLARRLSALGGSRAVWFGGHSLGGALATLAADRFPDTAGVATIASPLVGDRAFAAAFDARFGPRALRYENDHDIVTRIPPAWLGYQHVGLRRHIEADGTITAASARMPDVVGEIFGGVGPLREVVVALQAGVLKIAPDFLLDHMPRGYTIDLWNDQDANGAG